MFIEILNKYKFDVQKLLDFGFSSVLGEYSYSRYILSGAFELQIRVTKDGQILWNVWDLEADEEYVLAKISTASGIFVGKVRLAVDEVFQEIIEKCGSEEVFKSPYAKLIETYVYEKYGDKFEYLWDKFPNNAVFRRQDNKKWYGAVLSVAKNKLGLSGDSIIEVLDLRGKPEEIVELVDGQKYFNGYHMNKKHWYTVCLDGTVTIEEIYKCIDESYLLAKK